MKPHMTKEACGVFSIATELGKLKLHLKTSEEEQHEETLQVLTEKWRDIHKCVSKPKVD